MKKNSVDVAAGFGRLAGPGRVSVAGADGAETIYQVKNVIVATGSTPRSLPGMEIDDKTILSSTSMLELTEVPKSLVVIGSGAVGVEFASMHSRFGSKVTIVEVLPRIVPVEDEEISRELAASFKRQGIAIYPETRVERITRGEGGAEVLARSAGDKTRDVPGGEGPHGGRPQAAVRRHRPRGDGRRDREGLRQGGRDDAHQRARRLRDRRRHPDAGPRPPRLRGGRASRSSTWRASRRSPSTTTRSRAAPTARPRSDRSA